LCDRFDSALGPASRRLIYAHVLDQHEAVMPYNNQGVAHWEAWALRYGWPFAARLIMSVLAIGPGTEIADENIVWREFDHVAEVLSDGRPYLCGGRFSAADLTFAALSAPVTGPPEYGTVLPQPDVLAPRTGDLVKRARAHPAGRFALAVYAAHRRAGEMADSTTPHAG
jgi:glutathione S-transferase